ncbi:hypothetical protein ACFL5Z_11265 [Planctomycetota bacterium]
MSVFKEKNGIFEGANRLCGPAGAKLAPAGSALTSRPTEIKKTRLEKHFDRLPVNKDIFSHSEHLVRFIAPYRQPACADALLERR